MKKCHYESLSRYTDTRGIKDTVDAWIGALRQSPGIPSRGG